MLGLLPYIEVLVCAGETPNGKPAPDPFLAAAEALGLVLINVWFLKMQNLAYKPLLLRAWIG